MNVSIEPGLYVIAVSGGIDSMVLLDILQALPGVQLVVAHFDHGIREDSAIDRQNVEQAARRYGLPFRYEQGNLGSDASENVARQARYTFLQQVKEAAGAEAIVTAHHQDDSIETAIINILRGTGRKGLSALSSREDVVRPLLHLRKQNIEAYAAARPHITWRNDSTNSNDDYLRNYIRHHLLDKLPQVERNQLLGHIQQASRTNPLIDALLLQQIADHTHDQALDRQWFILLPYAVSCEVMAAWLRANDIRTFDRRTIVRLVVAAKVALPGKAVDIIAGYLLNIGKSRLNITRGSLS